MTSRLIAVVAGAIAVWAGSAFADPQAQTGSVTLENRAQLIAARMSQGEAYDQASRAVPQVRDERSEAILAELSKGYTYRQAKLSIGERADAVNGRWNKHAVAMLSGVSHEAGWAASTRP